MASVSNLRINAIVNDQATAPLKRINGALRTLGQGQGAATKGVTGFAESLTGAASSGGMAAFGIGVATAAVVAIGAAAVAAGIRAGKAASAYNEAANKVDVVFGNSADAVKSFAETASDALGTTATEALTAAGSYGAMFRAIGIGEGQAANMSVAMTRLAGDMASFNNVDPTEMLQKLQSALSGEARPLREYGVYLNEAAVEAEAFRETGKAKAAELTESEKVLARYNLILRQTALQQGDLARTADSPANAIRRISATIEDTFRVAGQALLPEIEPSLKALYGFLKDVREGIRATFASPATQDAIAGLGEAFRAFLGVFHGLRGLIMRRDRYLDLAPRQPFDRAGDLVDHRGGRIVDRDGEAHRLVDQPLESLDDGGDDGVDRGEERLHRSPRQERLKRRLDGIPRGNQRLADRGPGVAEPFRQAEPGLDALPKNDDVVDYGLEKS